MERSVSFTWPIGVIVALDQWSPTGPSQSTGRSSSLSESITKHFCRKAKGFCARICMLFVLRCWILHLIQKPCTPGMAKCSHLKPFNLSAKTNSACRRTERSVAKSSSPTVLANRIAQVTVPTVSNTSATEKFDTRPGEISQLLKPWPERLSKNTSKSCCFYEWVHFLSFYSTLLTVFIEHLQNTKCHIR
jgi:hypothetical protein